MTYQITIHTTRRGSAPLEGSCRDLERVIAYLADSWKEPVLAMVDGLPWLHHTPQSGRAYLLGGVRN